MIIKQGFELFEQKIEKNYVYAPTQNIKLTYNLLVISFI